MKHFLKLSLFVLVVALASCKKDEDTPIVPLVPGGTTLHPDDPSQFHASIDGMPFSIVLDTTYIDTTGQRNIALGGDTLGRVYFSILQDTVLDEPAAWIYLGMNTFLYDGPPAPLHILPTEEEFDYFFTRGMETYSDPGTGVGYFPFADTTVEQMRGAAFFYRDTVNDVVWSTQGPQQGSFFHVDTIAPMTIQGQYHVKARMSFSCKLYDGNGAVRNLTNGVFIGIFRNG